MAQSIPPGPFLRKNAYRRPGRLDVTRVPSVKLALLVMSLTSSRGDLRHDHLCFKRK